MARISRAACQGGAALAAGKHSTVSGNSKMKSAYLVLSAASVLCSDAAIAADNPSYNTTVLTIPRVDSPDQIGLYQDAVLQQTPQGGFTITSLKELGKSTVYNLGNVQTVEVKKSGTLPVSVYLQVSGNAVGCDYDGPARLHQRLQGTRFDVNVSASHIRSIIDPSLPVCTMQFSRPFKLTVALDVYGLAAGTYTYNVQGVTGSFSLEADNKFADDCDVLKFGNCTAP